AARRPRRRLGLPELVPRDGRRPVRRPRNVPARLPSVHARVRRLHREPPALSGDDHPAGGARRGRLVAKALGVGLRRRPADQPLPELPCGCRGNLVAAAAGVAVRVSGCVRVDRRALRGMRPHEAAITSSTWPRGSPSAGSPSPWWTWRETLSATPRVGLLPLIPAARSETAE